MRIGVLGTGMVGRALSGKLAELGHDVKVGSRTAGDGNVTFADAAADAEIVFNCTNGAASLDALGAAGDLAGKIVIDVANPLDFSGGGPALFTDTTDSLGERIQAAFPETKVVKSLNTLTASLMVDPTQLPEGTTVFVSGDDARAKATVSDILTALGHTDVIDLGGIESARGTEMLLPLWLRTMGALGTGMFNIKVVR